MLDVALLGIGGTFPLPGRPLSALLLRLNGDLILIDCGEGTQVPLRALGWGLKAISAVCITHVHGDHVTGLPGLMLTVGNAGRTERLDVYGPPGLRRVVRGLRTVAPYLPYPVQVHELRAPTSRAIAGMRVEVLQLEHGVPCIGYRFEIDRGRRFLASRAAELGVPLESWKRLQHGHSVKVGARTIRPDDVLGPDRRGLSLAFITDSNPIESIVEFVRGVDLLVCESNHGEEEDRPKARLHGHMLVSEAAEIARQAKVGQLWLTHFSASISDPNIYLDTARDIF